VALAIADELPDAAVTATDTSAEALRVARANAERLGLSDRVSLEQGTLVAGPFDLLVANLPYVTEAEWEGLAPEIREFEPRVALVSGSGGLEAIEDLLDRISAGGPAIGHLALEVGAGQAPAVRELVSGAGYGEIDIRPDLAGVDRVVVGRRPGTGAGG
jgi:release factor glutamine methyltransferase